MDELLMSIRRLRKDFGATNAALAVELTGISKADFLRFIDDSRKMEYLIEHYHLPKGQSASVTIKKGNSIVRVTVSTKADYLGS